MCRIEVNKSDEKKITISDYRPIDSYFSIHHNTEEKLTHIFNHNILLCTVPYNTIPCNTIQYHTLPYNTIPYNTIPYHTIQYDMI